MVVLGLNDRARVVQVEVRPVLLEGSGWGTVPPEDAAATILWRFSELSGQLAGGSYGRSFYRDMAEDLIGGDLRDILAAYKQVGLRGVTAKLSRLRMRHLRRLTHKLIG